MKIWLSYGSEHSANLVIVGRFKTEDDATKAAALLKALTETAQDDEKRGNLKAGFPPIKFSDAFMQVFSEFNFSSFDHKDPEQLLYDHTVQHSGKQIVITTEELTIEAFLKVLLDASARVEVYSAHDYPSSHGRPTFSAD